MQRNIRCFLFSFAWDSYLLFRTRDWPNLVPPGISLISLWNMVYHIRKVEWRVLKPFSTTPTTGQTCKMAWISEWVKLTSYLWCLLPLFFFYDCLLLFSLWWSSQMKSFTWSETTFLFHPAPGFILWRGRYLSLGIRTSWNLPSQYWYG